VLFRSEKKLAQYDAAGAAELKSYDERIQYYQETMSEKVLKDLVAEAKRIRATKPEEQFIRALLEAPAKPPVTRVFHRGDHEQPKDEVIPRAIIIF